MRLSVFRSNKHISAQLIDDIKGITLVYSSDRKILSPKTKEPQKVTKIEKARKVGENLAKIAISLKIKKIVFDRRSYKYHGRIKALAEGAREGGLSF